ncbi:DNA primase small subunit [Spraguea lophii 42_110]|uniref:DNA primase small subunit n=1 Tax=Spraguea lophii (strain 42_110) TaxID=1358809 RepID=S7XV03_SPRLO|nr:DNA primase small subunit [Spraguea lophii 42_110]
MENNDFSYLPFYYSQIYPFNKIYKWLNTNENREFSFTLQNNIYCRYLSFKDTDSFKEKVIKENPIKIDIGAEYYTIPHKNITNPKKKELTFDVDLTDYERTCCTDKLMCNECFIFVKIAINLLEYSLKEEFGFKDIKFIFSGGRGVHCWVSDKTALYLDDIERRSILNFLKPKDKPLEYQRIIENLVYDYHDKDFNNYFIKLDAEITSSKKHLLKSPFCVHPRSKKICVPLQNYKDLMLEDIPDIHEIYKDNTAIIPFLNNF